MASRRVRIKGLAKIPQRRKNATKENEQQPDISELDHNSQTAPLPSLRQSDNLRQVHDKTEVNEVCSQSIVDNASQEKQEKFEENKEQVSQNKEKQTLSIRRKFIKPAVTVSSVNRRIKEKAEIDHSDKIVVLNNTLLVPSLQKTQLDSEREKQLTINPVTSDVDYPPPPLSPTKLNRSRIKAVPRFGQRLASFSASESEDEAKRFKRVRNDSVCSTTSAVIETLSESPQKKEVLQQRQRKTDQARKLAEARRGFYLKFGNNKPDRKKLTMMDLIFYNPTTNLMSHDTKTKPENEEIKVKEKIEEIEEKSDSDDETNEMPAPQVKIGPNGEIVIDEQSLVIENKRLKKNREQIEKSSLVDGNLESGYGIYKKAKRSKDWTKNETIKFYKALNTIGTDFTLMCELFPRRSHRELRQKFKKEERVNRHLIDRAVMQPCNFDFNEFKKQVELEEKELKSLEKHKSLPQSKAKQKHVSFATKNEETPAKKRNTGQEKKRKKDCLSIMSLWEDSEDESDISTFTEDNDGDNEDENESENDVILQVQSLQKPTRSGRVPKILNRYNPVEPNKPEPGSLKVVSSSGPNGEPVYKVFMVTTEEDKQRGLGKGVVSSLLKGVNSEKILTVSVTKANLKDENVTISADEDN